MNIIKNVFLVSLFFILFFCLNSCSIAGYLIGKSADSPEINNIERTTHELFQLEPGTEMMFYMSNGDTLYGEFVKLDSISDEEYSKNYSIFIKKSDFRSWFPSFNDTIGVNSCKNYIYIFKGFDFGCIRVISLIDSVNRKFKLKNISYISSKNCNKLEMKTLIEFYKSGILPISSNILIRQEKEILSIATKNIIYGKIESTSSGRIIGFLVGATVDYLMYTLWRVKTSRKIVGNYLSDN